MPLHSFSLSPYLGAGHTITYGNFTTIWQHSDRAFTIIFPAAKQAQVSAILAASGWNKSIAYANDLAKARVRLSHLTTDDTAGHVRGYPYLQAAWDATQLGRYSLARSYESAALFHGASRVDVSWIQQG